MVDVSVTVAGMTFTNPVLPAAGPPVKDAQAIKEAVAGGAGGIVTKTISVQAAQVPRPCMAEIRGGFLNAELWSELSPEHWLEKEYPAIQDLEIPIIIGLGYSGEDIRHLAPLVEPFGQALELSTHYLGNDTSPVVEAVEAARQYSQLPVFVKLSPQVDIPRFAKAAVEAGAHGLAIINSLGPCLDLDLHTGRPLMGASGGFGWLSGRAIFPVALRAVYQAAQVVDVPILGVGGITSGIDVAKMIMAGAQAVQICTAPILEGPKVYGKIVDELKAFMETKGYEKLEDFRGLALQHVPKEHTLEKRVPRIQEENCTACGLCVQSCAYKAMELNPLIKIDAQACFGCGLCVTRCRFDALHL